MVSRALPKYLRTRYPKREERRELSKSWFRNGIYIKKTEQSKREFKLEVFQTNPLNPRSS